MKFRGVFSRDNLPKAIRKRECGIINLDDQAGPGTHWVCYRNLDGDFCEYFDSFGLRMPYEVERYLIETGKQLTYSGDEIQERDSVLCGYWCLYYLLERQSGRSVLDVIHDSRFGAQNQNAGKFVRSYFGSLHKMTKEIYCVKERKRTPSVPGSERYERARNGRLMLKAKCANCGITKNRFVSEKNSAKNLN